MQHGRINWPILEMFEECCGRVEQMRSLRRYGNDDQGKRARKDLNVPAGSRSCILPYFPSSWAESHTLSRILPGGVRLRRTV